MKSIVQQHCPSPGSRRVQGILKQMAWATIKKYKDHGTLCRLPGSGWHLKLTSEVLALIEERMRTGDETTAM